MQIKGRFDHFNVNVTDLDRSLRFYDEALGLPTTAPSSWFTWATDRPLSAWS